MSDSNLVIPDWARVENNASGSIDSNGGHNKFVSSENANVVQEQQQIPANAKYSDYLTYQNTDRVAETSRYQKCADNDNIAAFGNNENDTM